MTRQQLGNSDLNITRIGIGAWAIGGGKWEFGWGPQNANDSIEAIHAGLDQGLNWIDTAAVYGLGHSETVVGRAIKGPHVRADESGSVVREPEVVHSRSSRKALHQARLRKR